MDYQPKDKEKQTMKIINNSKKVFIYLRVSRVEQDENSQLFGIDEYCIKHKLTKNEIIKDKISGSTPWKKRGLSQLENKIIEGDILLVAELSRIGRNTADVLDFLAWAANKSLTVIATKSNMQIDGSIQSKIFTTIMALASEIERDFNSQRTKEGLAVARAAGKQIGRPKGKATKHSFDEFKTDIETALSFGVSKAYLCRLHQCSLGKLNRAITMWKKQGKTPALST
jgi:DNA invertase Pin-like site-specific DNA recombinase